MDFVILSRGHAEGTLTWTRAVMTALGLAPEIVIRYYLTGEPDFVFMIAARSMDE
ncbi:hypothetical protein [Bradyrhizobium sp. B120]|uniref:hypothetical protein n=1 Tax=Bradyrhizobium sp. B120 TaxID=3410088 RepID=UPI003B98168F